MHTEVFDVVNVKDLSHYTPQSPAPTSPGRETPPHKHPKDTRHKLALRDTSVPTSSGTEDRSDKREADTIAMDTDTAPPTQPVSPKRSKNTKSKKTQLHYESVRAAKRDVQPLNES
jgi:hypothetical protein